jgi:CBS-domain-containing membrane protein
MPKITARRQETDAEYEKRIASSARLHQVRHPAIRPRRMTMRAIEIMMGTPYHCAPETNLGQATEMMWLGNCGFLPVTDKAGQVIGVVTDRDICVALGTRNKLAGDLQVADVMSKNVHSCSPDDDIHAALRAMRDGHVRRLPVITKQGTLVGVISIDDVLVHAEPATSGKNSELSSEEVVRTCQAINVRQLPQAVAKRAVAA